MHKKGVGVLCQKTGPTTGQAFPFKRKRYCKFAFNEVAIEFAEACTCREYKIRIMCTGQKAFSINSAVQYEFYFVSMSIGQATV